jgi:hypothetical protein
MRPAMSFIVKFYDPEQAAKDAFGRTLESMLEWSDNKLEQQHN